MPKYWVKNYCGSKAEDGERKRERKLVIGARKHAWRTQAAWAKNNPIWCGTAPGNLV